MWRLVYATEFTEADGAGSFKVVAGSLKALRDAVINAADVKVVYRPRGGFQWRSVTCSTVTVRATNYGSEIRASAGMALALNSPAGDGLGAESFVFDSNGSVSESHFNPIEGVNWLGAFYPAPMRWYVRDYEVSLWGLLADLLRPVSIRGG